MLKQNSELRAQAREALRGKWPMAAVAALIYSAIAGGLSSIPFIGWIGFVTGRSACCVWLCCFNAWRVQRSGRS